MVFQGCFKEVLRVLKEGFKGVSRKIEGCFNGVFKLVSSVFERSFKDILGNFKNVCQVPSFKEFSAVLPERLKVVLRDTTR